MALFSEMMDEKSDMMDEISALRASIERLLICGNHIATYRTDRWPGYVLGGLTRDQQCEHALRVLGATQEYDMWCCWSGMMQERDALQSLSQPTEIDEADAMTRDHYQRAGR